MSEAFSQAFWRRVERADPAQCWPWKGCIRHDGYGQFNFGYRSFIASRVAYELATGRSLGSLRACHHCDNPPCVNPAHLFAGTDKDNARDRTLKMRGKGQRNRACIKGHPYDAANTYIRPNGARQCRACNNAFVQRRRKGLKS